ncbi:MAG: cobalamin B12-binding domain-containing protein [Phycisphaerales bacterium]
MNQQTNVERLFEALITGDRDSARRVARDASERTSSARALLTDLFWPTHELIEKLHRSDQLDQIAYHLSTRLLRVLVDQTSALLPAPVAKTKTVFAACGPSQGEELAAQIAVDLLENSGFEVTFTGGGVPGDEILGQVQSRQPDYLVLFASAPSDLPDIRMLIDRIREIGACQRTRIVVGGGVFARAEGLAEEIGAGMSAASPMELVEMLTTQNLQARFRAAPTQRQAATKPTGKRRAA